MFDSNLVLFKEVVCQHIYPARCTVQPIRLAVQPLLLTVEEAATSCCILLQLCHLYGLLDVILVALLN
jgi:hypothetical protein